MKESLHFRIQNVEAFVFFFVSWPYGPGAVGCAGYGQIPKF